MKILMDENIVLTTDIIHRMITYFNTNIRGQLQYWKDYYDGNQDICGKTYTDASQRSSNIVTNFCKNITENYVGYMGNDITYKTDEEDIIDILKYNDYAQKDSSFLQDALIYGTATELMYIDTDKQVRFDRVDPRCSFGIFANNLEERLMYFIRIVAIEDWQFVEQLKARYLVYVYDDKNVTTYYMVGDNGHLEFIEEKPHYFSQCPANIFYLPAEKSIFDCVISLQDAYNEALSDTVDDCSYFSDAYLLLKGATLPGDTDAEKKQSASEMRKNRLFELPYENASMEFLTKGSNDSGNNELLNRLKENIYRIAQCPDFSDNETFGNATSGVSLKYKLSNIENRASEIQYEMKKALQRRIEIICGFIRLKYGDTIWRDIDIIFKRNIPTDISEMTQIVTSLSGIVSRETLLTQVPFVKDINEEIKRVDEEKMNAMQMYASDMFPVNENAENMQDDE